MVLVKDSSVGLHMHMHVFRGENFVLERQQL